MTAIVAILAAIVVLGVLVRVAIRFVLAAGLAAVAVLVISHLGDAPPRAGSAHPQDGRVIRVADGDTVTVRVGQRDLRVRLLGIDAPEATALRFGRADCGGQAASRHLRRLAMPAGHGIGVRVRTDPPPGTSVTSTAARWLTSTARAVTLAKRSYAPATRSSTATGSGASRA